jgi:hypothetical protein
VTAPPPWDGSVQWLVDSARVRLGLTPNDPDVEWLGYLAASVIDQIVNFLDEPGHPPLAAPVPPPVTTASVQALVEAYSRKDAKFGITGAWSSDGVALRVSADWLDGVKAALRPYVVQYGMA